MEEKIENNNIWKTRIIFILAINFLIYIFRKYIYLRHSFLTSFDNNLGELYNICSLGVGILTIIIVAAILYFFMVERNAKLTKASIKDILWKIFIILFIIFNILLFIKNQKSIEANLPMKPDGLFQQFVSYSERYREYLNVNIEEKDVFIYGSLLFVTIIMCLIVINIILRKRLCTNDIIKNTSYLSFICTFLINIIVFIFVSQFGIYSFSRLWNAFLFIVAVVVTWIATTIRKDDVWKYIVCLIVLSTCSIMLLQTI